MSFTKQNKKGVPKSMFAHFLEEMKKPIHLTFYEVFLYKVISTIQILALILEISAQYFEADVGKWGFLNITHVFIFRKLFVFDNNNTITGIAFIISWIFIFGKFLLLSFVFIGFRLNLPYVYKFSKPLRHLMLFYQFVLFQPLFVFLFELAQTCSEFEVRLFGSRNKALFLVMALFLIIMNFSLGLLNIKAYSPLYAQKTFTKRNANLAFLDFIFKTLMSAYLVFVSSSVTAKWIIIGITLIYILLCYFIFHKQLPFFQIKALETYCYLLGAKIAMALSIFIVGIFDEFWDIANPDLPVVAFILSLPFSIMGQQHKMVRSIRKAIVFEEKNFGTENQVFIHLLAIRILFKKGAQVSLKFGRLEATHWHLKLSGVISRHHDKCDDTLCPCKAFLESEDSFKGIGVKKEKYKDLEIILMRDLYERGLARVPYSELILLNLAQFYLLYLENYLKSYLVLQAFEKKSQKSFETEIMIEYLKKRIQERMELKLSGGGQGFVGDYESNSLNITALVQNDVLFIQLKKLVNEQVLKQLKFWDLLENFEMNTRTIETCCEEIDLIRAKIEKLWDNLSKINHKCTSHYLLYGLYQTLVNNTTKKGERFLNDYNRMHGVSIQEKEGIINDNLYDSQTVVIRISMRRDKIGIIEECSGDTESTFGYQGSELMNMNVATMMSSFFKERHHVFILNHFDKGTENVLNKMKRLFGYHKEGYIFPIFLYVSIYPNIETGLSYMGIIRPRKVYNNHILLKSDGTIDSYSPEIAEYLGLESRKKYNITEICPSFEKINNAFNYVTKGKYSDLDEIYDHKPSFQAKRSNEYQVKVLNAENEDAVKIEDLAKYGEDNSIIRNKIDLGSLVSENEAASYLLDKSKGQTLSGIAFTETKEETAQSKTKDKNIIPTKNSVQAKSPQRRLKRLNTEDMEEYKRVYDQLSINGSVLSFYPHKEKLEASLKNYLCTVSDEIFDRSILRIITLGRNDENVEVEREVEKPKLNSPKERVSESSRDQNTSFNKELLLSINNDVGISNVVPFEEAQHFRNPFEHETEGTLLKEFKEKKETLLHLLKSNQDEGQYNSVQISSFKSDYVQSRERNLTALSPIFVEARNSGETEQDQDKLEVNDSKEFVQEMLMSGNIFDRAETSTTGSVSMRGGIISKFEALLYKKEEGKTSGKLKSYYLIIALCIIMVVLNTALTSSHFSQSSNKVQKVLSVGERINLMLGINYHSRILNLDINNYILPTRHWDSLGISDFSQYTLGLLKLEAEDIIHYNNDVLNHINDLHKKSRQQFFDNLVKIRYTDIEMSKNNVEALNSFEAVDTIAFSALKVSSRPSTSLSQNNNIINYILANSMNEIYLEMQNGFKIYQNDLDMTLSNIKTITLGITIGVISAYVLFLIFLVKDLTKTHQDKIRFWNSLIKLDTLKSMSYKKMLHVIKENLENSTNHSQLKKSLMESKKHTSHEVKAKAKDAQANGFKRLKSYKLKNRSYFIVFPFLAVLLVILAYFITSEVIMGNEVDKKAVYMTEIINSETYYQINRLTLNGIYQLLVEGENASLTGSSITTIINQNLVTLSRLGDFIGSFRAHPYFDPKSFIQTSLCEMYIEATEKSECIRVAGGLNTQGLLGILTFLKTTLETLTDLATQSNGSPADITNALNQDSLIRIESNMKYIEEGFDVLINSLAESELKEQDTFQTNQIIILLVFIVLLGIINYFMVWKGFKRLDGQKFDNMKILRVIPAPMILESKMLKTYLLKSFKDDLSSITNKI